MRLLLVSDRYGSFTGFPAWTLELRLHGPLRPGWERERGYSAVWGLGCLAILKTENVGPRKARPEPRRVIFPLWPS